MASGGGSYASMTRRKSEPKLSMSSDRSTLPHDSAAYMLFLEAQVAKNLTTPQQLHALDERMAALAAAQKAVASRCSELDGKMSGSVRLVKIAQSYAEQVGQHCRRAVCAQLMFSDCSSSLCSPQVETDAKAAIGSCTARISDAQDTVRQVQGEAAKLSKQVAAATSAQAVLQEQMAVAASSGTSARVS